MTRLRKMMLEELQRRNYAETTIRHQSRDLEARWSRLLACSCLFGKGACFADI